jgi:hypothetical protein
MERGVYAASALKLQAAWLALRPGTLKVEAA